MKKSIRTAAFGILLIMGSLVCAQEQAADEAELASAPVTEMQASADSGDAAVSANTDNCYIFITSSPLGASVWLDGVSLNRRTPVVLKGLPAGRHKLLLRKNGFIDRETVLNTDGSGQFEFRLVSFDEALKFRGQRSLDGIRLALPLFIGASAVFTAREIIWPHESSLPVEPEIIASAAVSGGLLAWDLVLESRKKSYVAALAETAAAPDSREEQAGEALAAARAVMAEGNFESALEAFNTIVSSYEGTRCAGIALYESARLSFILGDREKAEADYLRLIDTCPLPEIYDRAIKGLSDCRLAGADIQGALELLNALSYCGDCYTPEEIGLFRESMLRGEKTTQEPAPPLPAATQNAAPDQTGAPF